MKRLVILLSILICSSAYGQHNFQITDDAKIIWQKVYETSANIEQIQEMIFNSGKFNDIAMLNDKLTCWINEIPVVDTNEILNFSNISILARDSNVKGFVTVQFKEGKYRVTIEQIQFIQKYSSSLSEKGEITYIEGPAINRKGAFNKMVEGNTLVVLDSVFAPMFEFRKPSHLSDEW